MDLIFPVRVPALRVDQPLGVYYVAVLPAEVLLEVAYSDRLSASLREDGESYALEGTQRQLQQKRLSLIADYINRADAAFPNTIILAANFRQADGLIEGNEPDDEAGAAAATAKRWFVDNVNDVFWLTIPTREKLAAVIDGQHRLFAFAEAREQRYHMQLICSVFIDLPKPYQAQLFATINSTQKAVDKSLTFELFGYNVEEESEEYWSPDKLAVFLTRRLGVDDSSPLRGRIAIAPITDSALSAISQAKDWTVSTAVLVEGIMRLVTTNPKKDANDLLDRQRKKRHDLTAGRADKSPLRQVYLTCQDSVLYTIVRNYLTACETVFWEPASEDSFITKTVGVQAVLDILRKFLAKVAYEQKDISVARFQADLTPAGGIDFSDERFRKASGAGRSLIRKAIEEFVVRPPQ